MKPNSLASLTVCITAVAVWGREGWYFEFSLGPNAHIGFNTIVDNFPRGVRTDSHTGLLTGLDFGYSFSSSVTKNP